MKLSPLECEALCEYVDGRRAAGAGYDVIAAELEPYTHGEDARMTDAELDVIEEWHRKWQRRQKYLEKQRASGDVRGGSGGIAEVGVDWQTAESAGVKVDHSALGAGRSEMESLLLKAEALRVVMYFKKALLRANYEWKFYRGVMLTDGVGYEAKRGPGRCRVGEDDVEWLWGAVVLRREGGGVFAVFEECRVRRLRPAGWKGQKFARLEMERRELDDDSIDVRDLSARLAALLHTCLGAAHSPFRNNEHLAQLLGVTREAMRVRGNRIREAAGMKSGQGLMPARGNGGRVSQAKRAEARVKISEPEHRGGEANQQHQHTTP